MCLRGSLCAVLILLLVLAGRDVKSREYIDTSTTEDWTDQVAPSIVEKGTSSDDFDCSISMERDLTIMQPLLLKPGSVKFVWPQPNSTTIGLHSGQSVELFCSHGFRKGSPGGRSKTAILTCDGAGVFAFNSNLYNISEFTCNRPVFHTAERTDRRCFNNGTLVRVGFELDPNRFASLYEVCFDEASLRSHYVRHQLTSLNDHHQRSVKRPSFLQGNFYEDLKMASLYTIAGQHAMLGRVLASPSRANALLDNKRGMYLSRGHLAAKSDFVFGSHQRASFWYINVAPQWQRFNGFNWQRVETGVKAYVAANDLRLTVYTGTYGVLKLPDGNGDPQEIFLDFDPSRDPPGRVPVPALFYKVLIDENHDAGVALIGVNNPYATPEEIADRYVVCRDVSDEIHWLSWQRHSIPDGYMYACDVNEFNRVTGHLTLDKPVHQLLL
ncbi:uncharacterized protein LOC128725985 [Anopheles nili]|uniref:uncharacterized protein LOC128725985 n=1 Tax=Anopheles nili TaxID=185578 RepID=UPI00237B8473|nr:uncharacterized protein LOC128725985 [Anopheles nili]